MPKLAFIKDQSEVENNTLLLSVLLTELFVRLFLQARLLKPAAHLLVPPRGPPASFKPLSARSSPSVSSNRYQTPDIDQVDTFMIQRDKFPEKGDGPDCGW